MPCQLKRLTEPAVCADLGGTCTQTGIVTAGALKREVRTGLLREVRTGNTYSRFRLEPADLQFCYGLQSVQSEKDQGSETERAYCSIR